jgi:hypothetical protein
MGMGSFHGFGGGSHQQYPGASVKHGRPKGPTHIDVGQGLTTDPDETRRLALEAIDAKTANGVPNRTEAIAMMAAVQGGTTDNIQGLASRLGREQSQTRCGLGFKSGGSGPMRFQDAPAAVLMAVIMGKGDERVKVSTVQAWPWP